MGLYAVVLSHKEFIVPSVLAMNKSTYNILVENGGKILMFNGTGSMWTVYLKPNEERYYR